METLTKRVLIGLVMVATVGLVGAAVALRYGNSEIERRLRVAVYDGTGMPAELEMVDIAASRGVFSFRNLSLADPVGVAAGAGASTSPPMLTINRGEVALVPWRRSSQITYVPRMALDRVELRLRVVDGGDNFAAVMQRLKSFASELAASAREVDAQIANPQAGGMPVGDHSGRYVIGEVVVWDLRVDAEVTVMGETLRHTRLQLPGVKFGGLGAQSDGLTAEQAVAVVLEGLLRHVNAVASQHLPEMLADRLDDEVRKMGRIGQFRSDRLGGGTEVLPDTVEM